METDTKSNVVSMRLRPQEQDMFKEIAAVYGLHGSTNAVRAAGRILVAMQIDPGSFLTLLERYEKEHPEAEPVRFVAAEAGTQEKDLK